MPTVLIDGTALEPNPKGVGRYSYHMINQISERLPHDWNILVFGTAQNLCCLAHGRPQPVKVPSSSELVRGLIHIPRLLRIFRPDVLVSPNESICYCFASVRRLAVLHDLNELIWQHQSNGNSVGRRFIKWFNQLLRIWALRRSNIVVCNSNWVRLSAVCSYGLDDSKIRIGYCGVDKRFLAVNKPAATAPVALPNSWNGYVLTFATGDERENYELLPNIWAKFAECRHDRGLIVAGVDLDAEYTKELRHRFRAQGLSEGEHYRFVGFLGDSGFDELVRLYAGADYYLELSAHEGFGMQLAEALAVGTTCLSSGKGALNEVGGGFPIPVDVNDHVGIGLKLLQAYQEGLERRDNSQQREFIARYSWDAVGKTVVGEIKALAVRKVETRPRNS